MARRHKAHYSLDAWRLAFEFVPTAYALARQFPPEERYELSSQLRRAATSVVLNIAEGAGRHSSPDFCRFLVIARGSITEMDTLLLLAEKLQYITAIQTDEALATLDHTTALVNGLIRKHTGDKG